MKLEETGLTFEDIKEKVNKYMIETYERMDFLAESAKDQYIYNEKGEKVIADPVMDVKGGTLFKNMSIPYDEFVEKAIRHEIAHYDLFGINGEEAFFPSFLPNCKCKL